MLSFLLEKMVILIYAINRHSKNRRFIEGLFCVKDIDQNRLN
jgi:hypothetical protein